MLGTQSRALRSQETHFLVENLSERLPPLAPAAVIRSRSPDERTRKNKSSHFDFETEVVYFIPMSVSYSRSHTKHICMFGAVRNFIDDNKTIGSLYLMRKWN